jgi:hypothetical protein
MRSSSRDTILIGDQDTLRFRTSFKKGEKVLFGDPSDSLSPGLEMIGPPVVDTINIDSDNIDIQTTVIVTSFDSGSYRLPSFVAYKVKSDGSVDTLSFDGGELHVQTIEIDTSSFTPFDVKDQMEYPFTMRDIVPWAGWLLLIAALVILIRYIREKIKRRKSLFPAKDIHEPPHLYALRKLEELRLSSGWKSSQKEFFSDLTEILREYIEKRYNVSAMEKTSAEIIGDLSRTSLVKEREMTELRDLFKLSDLVKFAKYVATDAECEESLPSAVRFVNSTAGTESGSTDKGGGK